MRALVLNACVALVVILYGSVARATTVDFTILDSATKVAGGSFSFATGLTGVLSYSNLSAFSVQILGGPTYDLTFAETAPNYQYFAYNTSTNVFVPTNIGGSEYEVLGALNLSNLTGFIVSSGSPEQLATYYTGCQDCSVFSGYTTINYNVITTPVTTTPLPAAFPLFGAGLGLIGLLVGRRQRKIAGARANVSGAA